MIKGIIFDWVGTLSNESRELFPYSEKVLKELKTRYKLGLVSLAGHGNKERREDIEATGVRQFFDSIIIDTSKKPEHYIRCMEEMGTTAATTAIVDDRTVRRIQIGNQLGCTTFWIQKGKYATEIPNRETGEPTHKINSVEDLLRML